MQKNTFTVRYTQVNNRRVEKEERGKEKTMEVKEVGRAHNEQVNPQAAGPYLTHLPVGRGFSAIP